ncbi:TPA: hypothetical protein ACIBE3_002090 [Salmonella enterica subsp. enterica serovar Reading]
MRITTEDKALLENLEKLAQSSGNDTVAVAFELPRMVTLGTSYSELHRAFASLLKLYSGLPDTKVSTKTVGALIKELKDKPVTAFTLSTGTVTVGYSLDDMLHSFRKALAGHENIINLKEKGGLSESVRQKDDNINDGFCWKVGTKTEQPVKQNGNSIRVISSFIPALNRYCDDKRILGLIGRIIAVVGVSPNCRQDEIEAAYGKPLDEIIDTFVREWSGVPQQGH